MASQGDSAKDAVFVASVEMPASAVTVQGYDFNKGLDYSALMASFKRTGFQGFLHSGNLCSWSSYFSIDGRKSAILRYV